METALELEALCVFLVADVNSGSKCGEICEVASPSFSESMALLEDSALLCTGIQLTTVLASCLSSGTK